LIVGTERGHAAEAAHAPDPAPTRAQTAVEATGNVVPLNLKSKVTRRWILGSLAAAAAAILVIVPLGSSLTGSTKATASPLPPIGIVPSTMSTTKSVEALSAAVASHPDPADFDAGRFDIGHWEGGAYGDQGVFDDRLSIPTVNETHINPDGSKTVRQTIGEPFSLNGESVRYSSKNMMEKPGTVIVHEFGPGESPSMYPTMLGRTAEGFYRGIQSHVGPNDAAVNDGPQGFLQIMGFIMMEGKIDQDESKSLLGALLKLDGLEVVGTTTDRWDRDAVAFGINTAQGGGTYRTLLMFNPATGRLTNYVEEFLVDEDPATQGDFETDMVTRYIAVSE
jgi:hypothetical protein